MEEFRTRAAPLSNNIHLVGGFKRSILDYRWKKDAQETSQTIAEIEKKAKRIAPAYSKGSDQYITDGADITTIGRKI